MDAVRELAERVRALLPPSLLSRLPTRWLGGTEDSKQAVASAHPLLAAVLRQDEEEVERLLGEQPQLVLERRPGKLGVVWAAAALGDAALVRRLAAAGADVEARVPGWIPSPRGRATLQALRAWLLEEGLPSLEWAFNLDATGPTHAAACSGSSEAVQALLEAGAAAGKAAGDTWAPLYCALEADLLSPQVVGALCAAAPGSTPQAALSQHGMGVRGSSREVQQLVLAQLLQLHQAGGFEPSPQQLASLLVGAAQAAYEPAWLTFLPRAAALELELLCTLLPLAANFPATLPQLQQLLAASAPQLAALQPCQVVWVVTSAAKQSAKQDPRVLHALVAALGDRLTMECILSGG